MKKEWDILDILWYEEDQRDVELAQISFYAVFYTIRMSIFLKKNEKVFTCKRQLGKKKYRIFGRRFGRKIPRKSGKMYDAIHNPS